MYKRPVIAQRVREGRVASSGVMTFVASHTCAAQPVAQSASAAPRATTPSADAAPPGATQRGHVDAPSPQPGPPNLYSRVHSLHCITLHYITLHDPPQSGSPMRHVFSFHHYARRWVVEEMTMTKGVCVCTCTARFRQPGCGDRPTVEDTMTRVGNRPLPPARLWGPVATAAPQRPEAEDTGGTL